MGLKSDITIDLGADFSEITKGIEKFSKKTKETLSNSIDLGLTKSIAKFQEDLKAFKNPINLPKDQFKKIDEMAKRIRDATYVKLEIDMSRATKAIDGLRYQILGTYASFKGLISKPLHASIDFNNSINEINRFAKLSKNELDNLKKDIWSLGKNNGVSMPDILKTTELSAQLGTPKEELKDFSQLALNLQVGLKLGVEESISSITKISKAFSLNTKELSIFGDEITSMAESTKTSAKAILEVTKTTLAGAKAFGLSAKEASALSASFLSVGLDSSEASSSINKFFTELNNIDNATPAFHQALAKMGMDAEQLKEDIQSNPQVAIQNLFEDLNNLDDEERFGVISELFGKKMANNINSAKDGVKAFNLALEASKDSSNALQKSVDRVAGDGFGDLVVSLGSAFKHLAVSIGDGFIPILKPAFSLIKSITDGIGNLLDNNKWLGVGLAGTISLLTALKVGLLASRMAGHLATLAIYPLRMQYKLLTSGVTLFNLKLAINNAITKATTIATTLYRGALFALNTGFKIASFGVSLFSKIFKVSMWSIKGALISTGIGALIVGLGIAVEYVVTNWSSLLPKLVGLWEWVKEKFSGIIDFFKNAFDWLGKAIDDMLSSVSGITDFLGLTDSKSIDINASKTSSFSLQGSLDETLARQNENKAKMLSQIQSSQTDNSRQIHDYKQITINTTGNAQEIARAINTYSYDDDDNF